MVMTIVSFIVGLSVILSFDWTTGGFRPDAGITILSGVVVAAIIFIAAHSATVRARAAPGGFGTCPACGRGIPSDSLLCPYCGRRLS